MHCCSTQEITFCITPSLSASCILLLRLEQGECYCITLHLIYCLLKQAVRPHLGAIAAKMEEMWNASRLSVSERNVLCDSMLAAAASGDPQLHSQVHPLKAV